MPEPTIVRAGEDKPAEPESSAPAEEEAPGEPAQASAGTTGPAEAPQQTYRTLELLEQWPALVLAVQKAGQAYRSLKQSARFLGWSLGLTERAVGSVLSFAEAKVSPSRPVVQCADRAVSEGVVALEKKFPAVRESPEKLYDAITQQITKMIRPALDKTAWISEIGRKKLDRVSKKMVKIYHRFLRRVDSWMDTLEKHLNGSEPEAVPSGVNNGVEGSASGPESVAAVTEAPPSGLLRQAARACWQAVAALSAFQVGATWWLLANTPLVGRLFAEDINTQPSMTSSSSSSSSSDVSSSSSSSRLSPPAAAEGLAPSTSLSTQTLHPNAFLTEPPRTTA